MNKIKRIPHRVEKGIEWLSSLSNDWYKHIDLRILKMTSCKTCIIAQVTNGIIPFNHYSQKIFNVTLGFCSPRRMNENSSKLYWNKLEKYWKQRIKELRKGVIK